MFQAEARNSVETVQNIMTFDYYMQYRSNSSLVRLTALNHNFSTFIVAEKIETLIAKKNGNIFCQVKSHYLYFQKAPESNVT